MNTKRIRLEELEARYWDFCKSKRQFDLPAVDNEEITTGEECPIF